MPLALVPDREPRDNSDMARLFIACHITPSPALRQILRQLATLGPRLKPVHPDQLHLTLAFLGSCDPDIEPALKQAMNQAVQTLARTAFAKSERRSEDRAMPVRWIGLGRFPGNGRHGQNQPGAPQRRPSPRVIFAVPDPSAAAWLCELARALADQLALCDLPIRQETRDFHPHLTLARVRPASRKKPKRRRGTSRPQPHADRHASPPGDDLAALRELLELHQNRDLGMAGLDRLNLIQSQLTPTGPIYTTRHEVCFMD